MDLNKENIDVDYLPRLGYSRIVQNFVDEPVPFPLSRELELLVQCARLQLEEVHCRRIQELLEGELDWDRVYQAAEFHRLIPLLNLHLGRFGASVNNAAKASLRSAAMAILATNMRLVGELHELSRQLSMSHIPVLWFKGPITAWESYHDLSLRPFLDLDLCVLRCDIEKTYELLTRLGYTPQFELSPLQRRIYSNEDSEIWFCRGEPAIIVDVHWELLPPGYSFSIAAEKIWKNHKMLSVNGHETPTLGDDDWLFFACVHASKHCWNRIGWLVDIAEHIRQCPADWDLLFRRPEARHAQRRLLITIGLVSNLDSTAIPDDIYRLFKSDNKAVRLVRRVIEGWERNLSHTASWPHRDPHFLAYECASDRITHLYRSFLRPTPLEWNLVPLPVFLHPLYFIFRPLRLIYRRLVGVGRVGS